MKNLFNVKSGLFVAIALLSISNITLPGLFEGVGNAVGGAVEGAGRVVEGAVEGTATAAEGVVEGGANVVGRTTRYQNPVDYDDEGVEEIILEEDVE